MDECCRPVIAKFPVIVFNSNRAHIAIDSITGYKN
jgi:hypothetical protein